MSEQRRKWKVLKSEEIFRSGFFRFRVDRCELPDGRVMPSYYVMEFADWVNIVALTSDNQMVLVEQYRHGGGETFLEIPGGSTQTHSQREEALIAGQRELLEETGYTSDQWVYCGEHFPNPALQSNRMHTFLALNCKQVAEPSLDPFEDLSVKLLPVNEAIKSWFSGEIRHSLISASLGLALKEMRRRNLFSFSEFD